MIVRVRNPHSEIQMPGPALVSVILERLGINRESVLVIRNGMIVAGDERIEDSDEVEVRPVISGGAFEVDSTDTSQVMSRKRFES
ncbi:MAG: MoaD/ThiS family protein [Microthrixaceae bacterium]